MSNGELLAAAEGAFDLFITTDQSLANQQTFIGRQISVLVLPTTSWPRIRSHADIILREIAAIGTGEYRRVTW